MPTIEQARQWYTNADPVHDFAHVMRVHRLAERIGEAEGADMGILLAAVLLHDSADAAPDGDLADYFERLAKEAKGEA